MLRETETEQRVNAAQNLPGPPRSTGVTWTGEVLSGVMGFPLR